MIKMLHNEAWELLVKSCEKSGDAKGTSKACLVSERTVCRLARQKRETGSVELCTSQRGRKPTPREEDKKHPQMYRRKAGQHDQRNPGEAGAGRQRFHSGTCCTSNGVYAENLA